LAAQQTLMPASRTLRIGERFAVSRARRNMRMKIAHNRSKAAAVESVDREFNEMFKGVAGLPVRLVVKQKSWEGSTLSFQLSAKMGLLSTPIKGTVEVTDHELIVDADLGMLNRLLPEKTIQEAIGGRIKGLLN